VAVEVDAGEDDAGVLIAGGHHVLDGDVGGAGAAQCLAVDRDRPFPAGASWPGW
jgi:hypothetical protein